MLRANPRNPYNSHRGGRRPSKHSSAPFLNTAATDGETMSVAIDALNALNSVMRQGKKVPRESIEPASMLNGPTQTVPQSSLSSMVIASNNMSLSNDDIPLPEATMATMSPLYSSPSAKWESDMKTEWIVNEYGTFAGKRMEPMPSWKTLTSPVVPLSFPQTALSELPRASLQPTTNGNPPLPDMHLHSVLGTTAPIPVPRTKLVTSTAPGPSLRTHFVTLPKANKHPDANMIHLQPAFGPSTPLMNSSSLHGNPQIIGRGPSPLKPHQKPCMY
ncbi:hypothetical protein POM88_050901 [Heracleum sosnowskyi]|uniref:Uncharacterized protein n=1 Tax=Heracleum sosnowskyi TaxID=360622 RepID=A0AAD8M0T4_9APIA|nr:hypothetical protein POM88_050901 [Heracleum sosnowskyi]